MLACLCLLFAACGISGSSDGGTDGGTDDGNNQGGDEVEEKPEEKLYSYYPKFERGEKLYYIKASDMTPSEYTLIASLQGILAGKNAAAIYIDARDSSLTDTYAVWREDLEKNYGLEFTYVADAFELVEIFKGEIADAGYILYNTKSINGATVACGMTGYLMADENISNTLDGMGFTKKLDYVSESRQDTNFDRTVFLRYKNNINKKMLFHQSPDKRQLRDYAIATKSYCFYVYNPSAGSAEGNFCREVYAFTDRDIPVMGWAENELQFVDINSEYGKITIASDWSDNLSFLSAVDPFKISRKHIAEEITPQAGKHYVAVMMSDGDNVQWYQGGFINSPKYYNNEYKGAFPITYGISASLSDLAPTLMQKIYNEASPNDSFIAATGAQGYINITGYSDVSLFAKRASDYMRKSDLDYLTFIDEGELGNMDASFWKEFSKYDNIDGAVWMYGDKYAGGKGAVHFNDGKPLVAFRDGIWEENPIYCAARVNSYKRDYRTIEGYSLINIHCWSTPFDMIRRFTAALDEDVILVSVPELMRMITKYVPHEDKLYLNDLDPLNPNHFNYAAALDKAYQNEYAKMEKVTSAQLDFDNDGMYHRQVSTQSGYTALSNGKVVLGGTDSGVNSYLLARLCLPASDGTKKLSFNLGGSGGYTVKIINHLGTVKKVAEGTASGSQNVTVNLGTVKNFNYGIIIEKIGGGEINLSGLKIV